MASLEQRKVLAAQGNYLKEGHLLKRQQGRHKRGSDQAILEFQQRYCTLTKKHFTYKDEMVIQVVSCVIKWDLVCTYIQRGRRGKSIQVKKIKFVEDVAPGTFLEDNSQSEPLDYSRCFQVSVLEINVCKSSQCIYLVWR